MKSLNEELAQVVFALRLGMEAQASDYFVHLIDQLWARLTDPQDALDASAIGPFLPELLDAQERGDLIRLADGLEFKLRPLL